MLRSAVEAHWWVMVRSDGLRWRLGVLRSARGVLVGDGVLWWVMVRSGQAAMEARRASQCGGVC